MGKNLSDLIISKVKFENVNFLNTKLIRHLIEKYVVDNMHKYTDEEILILSVLYSYLYKYSDKNDTYYFENSIDSIFFRVQSLYISYDFLEYYSLFTKEEDYRAFLSRILLKYMIKSNSEIKFDIQMNILLLKKSFYKKSDKIKVLKYTIYQNTSSSKIRLDIKSKINITFINEEDSNEEENLSFKSIYDVIKNNSHYNLEAVTPNSGTNAHIYYYFYHIATSIIYLNQVILRRKINDYYVNVYLP
jgi:hypothetical protein